MGNDVTITIAGQSGNFQLNVMLPVIAYNLLQSIELLAAGRAGSQHDRRLHGQRGAGSRALGRNPILVTALNPVIGYEKGAKIAKRAYAEGRPILEVAIEETDLSPSVLAGLLDPAGLTRGGEHGGPGKGEG